MTPYMQHDCVSDNDDCEWKLLSGPGSAIANSQKHNYGAFFPELGTVCVLFSSELSDLSTSTVELTI